MINSSEHFRASAGCLVYACARLPDVREGIQMLTQPGLLPRLSWSIVAAFLFSTLLYGQAPTGSIAGTVHDASGGVVPNAVVSVTNRDSGLARNLTTSMEGSYNAAALPPGVYQLKVVMQG